MPYQVQFFSSIHLDTLEALVNPFLESLGSREVVNIEYKFNVDQPEPYIAIILYEILEKQSKTMLPIILAMKCMEADFNTPEGKKAFFDEVSTYLK